MTLPFFIGVLTLAPAVVALLILLSALPLFAPILKAGDLLRLTPAIGDQHIDTAWFSFAYRIDAFGVFAAYGIVFLVTPLLLWMAFHGESALVEIEATGDDEADETATP